MRKVQFSPESFYHLCNRSNDERPMFLDEKDYARFLFLILFYQIPISFHNIGHQTSYFIKHSMFNITSQVLESIKAKRRVELNAFAIMPNHFHLLVQAKEERGISLYLQRVQNAYAKYFNAKYKKLGHLFQGYFRAVAVETDEQLIYLSAYIHRNPRDIQKWENKECDYPWSSYQDCVKTNRWGQLFTPNIILDQFSSKASYRKFVDTSTAKLKAGKLPAGKLLD